MAAVLPASPDAPRLSPDPLKAAFNTQGYLFDVPSRKHHNRDAYYSLNHSHSSTSTSTYTASTSLICRGFAQEEARDGETQHETNPWSLRRGRAKEEEKEGDDEEEEEYEDYEAASDTSSEPSSMPETPSLVSPPAADDTFLEMEPSRHVDYLSHTWKEEDIWSSWRYVTSRKHVYSNGIRLENASWRTWAKSKYNLGTISPETLNW